MNKFLKLAIGLASIVCITGIIYFSAVVWYLAPSNARDNQNSAKQKETMSSVLAWGRLAPFPANAANVSIETEGNSFTRSFHASFVAPKQDIQVWINDSPGLNEAAPEELSSGKVWYRITPGGGANKAEVTINYILNSVEIYVSWG
jgi:hypothetical protein